MDLNRTDTLRTTDTGPEQQCNRCGEWWPLDEDFYNADASRPTGRALRCRACCKEAKVRPAPATASQGLPW